MRSALLFLFVAAAQAQTGPVTRHTGAGNGKVLQSCPIPANATAEQKGFAVEACFDGVPVGQNYTLKLQGTKTAPSPAPTPAPTPAPSPAPAPAPAPAPGSPVAKIQATRLSGPAPLAVLFDATGTTGSTDAFHKLTYQFSFGDDRGLNWAVSGAPKNVQNGGPIAAHVYDLPGTYVAKVRAIDPSTQLFTESVVTVNVDDPALVYSGTKTVCVSTSSNFTGCPTGSLQQTALPASLDGKRVLLRRGETFGAIKVLHQDDGVIVGSFGTGVKPRVATVEIGLGRPETPDFPDEITVMDLDVANGIFHEGSGSRFLFLRNDLDDASLTANNRIYLSKGLGYWAVTDPYKNVASEAFYEPRELFIVENRIIGSSDSDSVPGHNVTSKGSRMAIIGNEIGKAYEHNIRLYGAHKTIVSHNAVRGGSFDGARHPLKLHSGGLLNYSDSFVPTNGAWASSQVVISQNVMGDPSDNNGWTNALRPQSERYTEGIEDVILENNRYARGPRTNTDILVVGRRITTRGNVRIDGGVMNISTDANNTYPLPAEWRGPYWIQ